MHSKTVIQSNQMSACDQSKSESQRFLTWNGVDSERRLNDVINNLFFFSFSFFLSFFLVLPSLLPSFLPYFDLPFLAMSRVSSVDAVANGSKGSSKDDTNLSYKTPSNGDYNGKLITQLQIIINGHCVLFIRDLSLSFVSEKPGF